MATATNQQLISALYIAVYNRAPETEGFNHWVGQLAKGMAFADVAAQFVTHPVFNATYGNKDNLQKVNAFYQNILGAPGDETGVNYWTAELNSGRAVNDVLASFLTASIEIDLNTSGSLGVIDWLAAKDRQNVLLNKAEVASYYGSKMGAASALTGDITSVNIVNDPAYQQAANALNGVTADKTTVAPALAWVDTNATPVETIWMTPLYQFDSNDDGSQLLMANLNSSFTSQPDGPKTLGNLNFEDFSVNHLELLNGGKVGGVGYQDKILVANDVQMHLNQINSLLITGQIEGNGVIDIHSNQNSLAFQFENQIAGTDRLSLNLSDNIQQLIIKDESRSGNVSLDLTLHTASGLDQINLNPLSMNSNVHLNLQTADVGGFVTTLVGKGNLIQYVAADNAIDTVKITHWGFNKLQLTGMDIINHQDLISFEQIGSIKSLDDLILTQQGNSVVIQAKYFGGNVGEIELVGTQLADLTDGDFLFGI